MRRLCFIPSGFSLVLLAVIGACSSAPTAPRGPGEPEPGGPDPNVLPAMAREFRGIWTATVSNIDWPSRTGLTADQQRAELLSIMDRAKMAGMNAIVLQVRPAGDALYRSSIEPWGRMFSGVQGEDPGYDPLEFAVEQAHRRGLELHAWVNPFRASNTADTASLAPTHLFNTRRDLIALYGTQIWMDPGEPDVHDHSMQVVRDIVKRYDIDAIHMDDYFYPYQQNAPGGGILPFPDSGSYARSGSSLLLGDWRRSNVDRFVERLYREVHEEKQWVRVGISPFGIWRSGVPAGIVGLDAYESIYADARKWLMNGWLDYLAPQLYWRIDPPQQSFTTLLTWWLQQNTQQRFVWPGTATYRVYQGTPLFTVTEIVNQVKATRDRNAQGVLFYNTTTTITRNGGEVGAALLSQVFAQPAISPATNWLDSVPPMTPVISAVTVTSGSWRAIVSAAGEPIRFWYVRYRVGSSWTTRVVSGADGELHLTSPGAGTVDWVVVNAVDRVGNASADAVWRAGG